MSALADLGIRDIRALLPRANWIIGRRDGTTSLTVHYNGPAVASAQQRGDGLLERLIIDARYQMRPGWGGTKNGAPGLMYHLAVDADGVLYQARDLDEQLWHCAHQDGNTHGLSVQFPLGDEQDATPVQWQRGLQLIEALRGEFGVPRGTVRGHLEWKHATACPGRLQSRVEAYRAGAVVIAPSLTLPAGLTRYQIVTPGKANVRQGPGTNFAIAGTLKSGTIIFVDVLKTGQDIAGENRWAHLALVPNEQADLGFIHLSLLQRL